MFHARVTELQVLGRDPFTHPLSAGNAVLLPEVMGRLQVTRQHSAGQCVPPDSRMFMFSSIQSMLPTNPKGINNLS